MDVNDAGRVALGGSMGPEIGQVEGTLIQRENGGDYLLGITSVSLLRGGVQVWTGEQVHIKREYVTTVYERKLSKGRTIALAAAGVGAVALIASQNLLGAGDTPGPDNHKDTLVTRRSPGGTIHFTLLSIGLSRLLSPGRP